MQNVELEATTSQPSAFHINQQKTDSALSGEDNTESLDLEKDCFFEPWRVPVGKAVNATVRQIVKLIEQYEETNQFRDRKRNQTVKSNIEATVRAIVCDMLH